MDTKTLHQYDLVTDNCQDLFVKKNQDYGTSWTILRPSSITDQIFIKAARLRSIEEKKQQLVDDEISGDYIGIINYCIMALIQLDRTSHEYISDLGNVVETYEVKRSEVRDLMMRKNHDYGEAWRDMRVSSMTDLILMKLFRIKQIEENEGETIVSEDIAAGFADIMNYAIFAMILLSEDN